jgi:hypothetical protein
MKSHKMALAGTAAAGILSLAAGQPEPFAVMDLDAEGAHPVKTVIQKVDYFANLPESLKKSAPFIVSEWDYNTERPHLNLKNENPFPAESVSMIAARGEYGFKGILLRAYAGLADLSVTAGELRGSRGEGVIPKENVVVARVAESVEYPGADLLVAPFMKAVPADALLGFAVLVRVPPGTPPGGYAGKIVFTADGAERTLPLYVRVPDFELPDADIPIGCYMPYYAADQSGHDRWAAKDYTLSRQAVYFRFCATRGMNSPAFFHFNIEFKDKNSREMSFDALDRLVRLIVGGGSCKGILLDLRALISHAERLAGPGGDSVAVYKDLVARLSRHLDAAGDNYPRFYLMAEEEIANGGVKQARYDRYGKPMQEVAGLERALLLDNSICEGKADALDRGARDGYRFRQYNSWTDAALEQARKDGAEVWTYNYSCLRPSFGLLLHRLNSRGHHQWADQWAERWTIAVPTDRGVISSLKYEVVHEGTIDYRWLLALKEKDAALLQSMVKDIPIGNAGASAYAASLPAAQNDLIRWRAVLALTGAEDASRTALGKPELRVTVVPSAGDIQTQDLIIDALQLPENYALDGILKGWAHRKDNQTGALHHTLEKERRLRAASASDEEFKQRNTPSYSGVWVNYNNRGIVLFSDVNHTKFGEGTSRDDNPLLWQDNCMEFFFRGPDGAAYQLIVNAANAKVMLKDGGVQDSSGIEVCAVEKKNGGYRQEILVPWSVFGLNGKPEDGTVWAFNAGREFHSWGQITCWARVESSFAEHSRWGALKFSGKKQLKYLKNINIRQLFPGANEISGTIPADGPMKIVLFDSRGVVVVEKELKSGSGSFHFKFNIAPLKNLPPYRLAVVAGGQTMEAESIPVISGETAVGFKPGQVACVSGGVVPVVAELNISPLELKNSGLAFSLRDSAGKELHLFQADPAGRHRIMLWLKASGLAPGHYQLVPVIEGGAGAFLDRESLGITVYPAVGE